MFCKKCGAPIKDGAKFCQKCGQPVINNNGGSLGAGNHRQDSQKNNEGIHQNVSGGVKNIRNHAANAPDKSNHAANVSGKSNHVSNAPDRLNHAANVSGKSNYAANAPDKSNHTQNVSGNVSKDKKTIRPAVIICIIAAVVVVIAAVITAVVFIGGGSDDDKNTVRRERNNDDSEDDENNENDKESPDDVWDSETETSDDETGESMMSSEDGDSDGKDGSHGFADADNQSSSNVPEPYAFTDEEWALLQHGAAYLILTYEESGLESGNVVYSSDMTQAQMNDFAYMYLNSMSNESLKSIFPSDGAKSNDNGTWHSYKKGVVQNVVTFVTGNDSYEPSEDTGVKCEADSVSFAAANGAPVYVTRRYNVIKTGDNLTVDVEMAALANVAYWVEGLYRLNMVKDTGSLGYVITSVEKLENPINTVSTEASSTLVEGNNTTKYQSANVIDKSMTTAWVEGASGNGIGEYIQLNFDGEQILHGIRIASGYMKSSTTYEENAAPTKIALDFSDGKHIEINLTDNHNAYINSTEAACLSWGERVGMYGYDASKWDSAKDFMDTVSFGQEIKTSYVRITILEVKSGTKFTDTCISEILPY